MLNDCYYILHWSRDSCSPGFQLPAHREERLGILPEPPSLLLGVGEVLAVLGFVGAEVDRDPGRVADVVDQLGHFGLHGRDALNSGRSVSDDGDTLVGPVVGFIPVELARPSYQAISQYSEG